MVGPRPKFFNVGSVGRLKEMEVDGTPKVGGIELIISVLVDSVQFDI